MTDTPSAPQPDQGKAREYKCALCGSPNPEHMCAGNARTRTPQADRLEELKEIALWGTDRERKEQALEQLIAERVREALEQFRVFCYEKEALQAWDSTASNRQGWLDTKLREFTALASADEGGKHEN